MRGADAVDGDDATPVLFGASAQLPVSRSERLAWIFIDVSNSVYSSVGVSGFLPLLLQEAALAYTGFPAACGNVVTDAAAVAAVFGNSTTATAMYFTAGAGAAATAGCGAGATCVGDYCAGLPLSVADCLLPDGATPQPLHLPGGVDPTSYASLSIAASVGAQVLVFLAAGAAADVGGLRKLILLGASLAGGFLSLACAGIGAATWWAGAPLLVATNVCFGLTTLAYNAYLPLLTRATPAVAAAVAAEAAAAATAAPGAAGAAPAPTRGDSGLTTAVALAQRRGRDTDADTVVDAASPPLAGAALARPAPSAAAVAQRVSDDLSNAGFGAGYVAGIVGIAFCLPAALTLTPLAAYQAAMAIVGVWWLVFTIVPAIWLRSRPGPPAPPGGALALIAASVRHTARTVASMRRRLPTTAAFLVLWMVGSDAVFLIGSIGGLYANSEVDWGCAPNAKAVGILTMFAVGPVAAAAGNFVYPFLARRLAWAPATPLLATLACTALVPVYGLLGLATRGAFGGLRTGGELIGVATWYGLSLGAYQAYCRAAFGSLVPRGQEAAYFSLYELTNRGSSALGPLVLSAIQMGTGDIRWGFAFVLLCIAIQFGGVARLDLLGGAADAAAAATATAAGHVAKDAPAQQPTDPADRGADGEPT